MPPASQRSFSFEKDPAPKDASAGPAPPADPEGAARRAASPRRLSPPAGEGRGDCADPDPAHAEALAGKTVYVVDAHSLIYQVYHALPEMTSERGEPVSAVYGFVRDILYLLEEKHPDYLLCAFDAPGETFRHKLYDAYKAGREAMPDDLSAQIPKIREVLDALGVPALAVEGYEADDILASLARCCDRHRARCLLVTGDKDCRQLINDRVQIYNIRKDEVYGARQLEDEWGIRPDQVVDFQALVGDPTDNVPGVPLVGPKIAGQLLRTYGTLEGVLEHAGEIKAPKRRENLLRAGEQARLSRRLVRLDDHVPLSVDWSAAAVGPIDRKRLGRLFDDFGFRSFAQRIDRLEPGEPPAPWQADYRVIDTREALERFLQQLGQQQRISLDTETTDPRPRWARLVGLSFAWREGQAFYLPLRGPAGEKCLDPARTLEALRPVLEDPAVEKVGQNLKYDIIVLRSAGIRLAGVAFDTMVASYLLDAGQRNHGMDELARRYLGHETLKIGELIGKGKAQRTMDQVPIAQVGPYAAEDADVPWRLLPILEARLRTEGLEKLYRDVEMPLVDVLAEMEYHGIRVDVDRLRELSRRYQERIEAIEAEIFALAGTRLNIASRKQLAEVLFEKLKLPVIKRTKTGPSTDAEVLGELAALHPLPARIVQYRQYAKLKSTYVDALPAMVHPQTGCIHASFHQVVTATGRLSSSDPNLQNIPVRAEAGREIRSAFTASRPGWRLLAADYSQIELRVLAHFSQDEELCRAFAESEDVHTRVAAEVFGVPADQVTSEMRRKAKAVNFGVIYGQSPFGLAKSLGIDREEAASFIDRYFERYPGVERFLGRALEQARAQGHVRTILGRRRAIRGIRPGAVRGLNLPERTAINTIIQGSAADLIKLAMLAIDRSLRETELPADLLLQIHDELVFEVDAPSQDRLAELVRERMCGVAELAVPLVVDLKVGDNWADCEAW